MIYCVKSGANTEKSQQCYLPLTRGHKNISKYVLNKYFCRTKSTESRLVWRLNGVRSKVRRNLGIDNSSEYYPFRTVR